MATAAEVKEYLKSNYELKKESENFSSIEFEFEDGRSQIVFTAIIDEMLQVSSPFATTDMLTVVQAVNAARDSVLGMKMIKDVFVISNSFPLADIDASEINWCLNVVAMQADFVEENSVGEDIF